MFMLHDLRLSQNWTKYWTQSFIQRPDVTFKRSRNILEEREIKKTENKITVN